MLYIFCYTSKKLKSTNVKLSPSEFNFSRHVLFLGRALLGLLKPFIEHFIARWFSRKQILNFFSNSDLDLLLVKTQKTKIIAVANLGGQKQFMFFHKFYDSCCLKVMNIPQLFCRWIYNYMKLLMSDIKKQRNFSKSIIEGNRSIHLIWISLRIIL